ncbi:MAG: enoyl-CoA hydratase/isomerase family protein [Elusimicrobia bacterium]|nr:enoyl-CoA hydratase/isomerase family protein [Elusimicrobiota bacterium]
MPQSELEILDQDGIRELRMNRPPSNALSRSLLDLIKEAAKAAGQDAGVRAVLLSSAIPKYFSSGLDVNEFSPGDARAQRELFTAMVSAHRALADCPKPVVAASCGAALLGGFILSLGCDVRLLSSERGRVSLSELRLGLSPTSPILRQVAALSASPGAVNELILKAKTLSASEALAAGLVDRVFPEADFAAAARREAKALAGAAPKAYASVKRARRALVMGPDEESAWAQGRRELEEILSGAELQEGISALQEKRRPRWP